MGRTDATAAELSHVELLVRDLLLSDDEVRAKRARTHLTWWLAECDAQAEKERRGWDEIAKRHS